MMDVITDLGAFPKSLPMPVITIGNFDGVHLGHQAIFRALGQRARETGGTSLVLTFDPHPLKILAPERCPQLITRTAKKLSIIQKCGIDVAICLPFTRQLAELTPETFVEAMLVRTIGVQEVHVGY